MNLALGFHVAGALDLVPLVALGDLESLSSPTNHQKQHAQAISTTTNQWQILLIIAVIVVVVAAAAAAVVLEL